MDHQLIRGAHVDVKKMVLANKKIAAIIEVDGKYQHEFSPKSRVSKHLELMEPKDLAARLSGGHYFFIDGKLHDFRDGAYAQNGFVHDDATIGILMNVIGVQPKTTGQFGRRSRRRDGEDIGTEYELRKVWDKSQIVVPGYKSGGDFDSRLSFTWNPFTKTVNSMFELVRLICENGAIGLTSWLNTKVPLFNRWHEHLDIAARQIQNRVGDTVIDRVQQMGRERGSVADCLLLEQHAFDRVYSPAEKTEDEKERLLRIMSAASVRTHLSGYYTEALFSDKALAAQVPGHLTTFDLYNIATEIRSHTSECSKSTGNALDRIANRMMFDDDRDYSITSIGAPKVAAFSSPETAFFGRIN